MTVQLAAAYGSEDRKVARDVGALAGMNLVKVRANESVEVNTDLIRAFLPFRRRR